MPERAVYIPDFGQLVEGLGGAVVTVYVGETAALAPLYYDAAKLFPAPNPIQLATIVDDDCGCRYGRWFQPVYVDAAAYRYEVSNGSASGVIQAPLFDVRGQDVSDAVVLVPGSAEATSPARIASRVIHLDTYGQLGGSAAENTSLINLVLAVASAQGGGEAHLPPGTFLWNGCTIPSGCHLVGSGEDATVLRSQLASAAAVTIAGDDAGLRELALDGTSRITGSVGIKAYGRNRVRLERVAVVNFDIGTDVQGGRSHSYRAYSASQNNTGHQFVGDNAQPGTGATSDHVWEGGEVDLNLRLGVLIKQIGAKCRALTLGGVNFEGNLQVALRITGASSVTLGEGCRFLGNATDLILEDNTEIGTVQRAENVTFRQVRFGGSRGTSQPGQINITGQAKGVLFDRAIFERPYILSLGAPTFPILFQDVIEEGLLTIDGSDERILRGTRQQNGGGKVTTEDATPTPVWAMRIPNGAKAVLTAQIAAKFLNSQDYAGYVIHGHFDRGGQQAGFTNQTQAFVEGSRLTGATSGATAIIVSQDDNGSFGTLELSEVIGDFLDKELITDETGGRAIIDGALTEVPPTLYAQTKALTSEASGVASSIDAYFDNDNTQALLVVVGKSGFKIRWYASVGGVVSD